MEPQGTRGRIDNYQIIDCTVTGQASSSFLVWDHTRRNPALLTIAHAATGQTAVVVSNETWVLGQLSHPGIPTLVDFGLTAEGRPWFVTALVRSNSVARAKAGTFTAREVAHLIGELASILGYAHKHGIVARSLNPDAIMLSAEIDGAYTTITDWSDAQVFGQSAPLVTADDAYLAPEVIRDLAGDQRADVYALGALAYWALTGATATASPTIGTIGGRRMTTAYMPASHRCPNAPQTLTTLIDHMLATDPWNRPASCVDVQNSVAIILTSDELSESAQDQARAAPKRWLDNDYLDTDSELTTDELDRIEVTPV